MKINKIITAYTALLLFASCESEFKEKVELNVVVLPTEGVTFKGDTIMAAQGTKIYFQLDGEPDFITFYSGESGKEYKHRNRTTIDPKEIASSKFNFSVWPQYGNKVCTENTMSIYYSESFEGLLGNNFEQDSISVEKHDWKELIPQEKLPAAPLADAGKAIAFEEDFTRFLGKKITLAFKYKTAFNTAAQPTWNFLGMRIANTFTNGNEAIQMPSTFGLAPVNMFYKNLPSATGIKDAAYATVTNNTNGFWNLVEAGKGNFKVAGAAANYNSLLYTWLVSTPFIINGCNPDKGAAIKNTSSRLDSYSYAFNKAGTYIVSFEGNNANYIASSSIVRQVIVKVIE